MVFSLRRGVPFRAISFLAMAAMVLSGCHPKVTDPNDPQFVVAEAEGWTITRAQLDHDLNEYLKEHQTTVAQMGATNMPVLETAMLRNMVMERLLVARAEKQNFKDLDKDEQEALGRIKGNFPTDQDFQTKLKQTGINEDELKKRIHEQVLIEKLFQAEALKNVEPTDQEVNDFYLGHKELFNVPPKVRASRILIMVNPNASTAEKAAKKKLIDAARARVMKGEDFSKVATDVSEDRYSQPRGGDIGYFARGENEDGFDDVAFNTKVGAVSPVFLTGSGYQFIKVTESKPAGTLSIDDERSAIVQNLTKLKTAQEEQDYTQKLMKDANVKYNIKLTEMPPDTATNAAPGAPAAPDESATPSESAAPGATDEGKTTPTAPAAPASTNAAPSGQ